MDESSATIVAEMAEQLDVRPWVLLVTRSRGPGVTARWPGRRSWLSSCHPFDEDESLALLEAWTRDSRSATRCCAPSRRRPAATRCSWRRCWTSPGSAGRWRTCPDSVGAVVAGQIDRLTPRDRTVLRFASVLGDQFALASLRTLVSGRGVGGGPGRPASPRRLRRAAGRQHRLVAVHQRGRPGRGVPRPALPPAPADAPSGGRDAGDDRSRTPTRSPSSWRPTSSRRASSSRAWVHARGRATGRARSTPTPTPSTTTGARRTPRCGSTGCPLARSPTSSRPGDVADLAGLSRESIAAYRRARAFVRDDPSALAR